MPTRTTETARVPEDISGRQRRMPVGGITWRHTFRALRHRNYRLFFWGQLVSLTGTWMQQTAMSWYVYQITNSKLLLGVVSAVGSAPMMLSSIWGGALADLYPKRSILVATQAAQMICAFLLAAGVWLGFATTPFIIIVAALNGISMGFDMPARQAFTVEMTSREDLLNAISLNSSIVNGARVIGPSVAGLMIGAVGVAMCFFLNGLSFIAVIAGLIDDASAAFRAENRDRFSGRARVGGNLVFDKTSACAHDFAAISSGRRFRLVVCGADAGVCTRCARTRRKWLRNSDVGERSRRVCRCPAGGDVWTSFHAAQNRTRRRLVIFRGDAGGFVHQKFSACARISLRRRIWNAAVFFNFQHRAANHRAGRNAGTRHGRVVAGVRRHDSPWQPRSRSRCAFRRHTLGARIRRNHLRRVGAGDVVRDSATRGAECEMICRAGASPAINSASGALALQFFNVFHVDNPTRYRFSG